MTEPRLVFDSTKLDQVDDYGRVIYKLIVTFVRDGLADHGVDLIGIEGCDVLVNGETYELVRHGDGEVVATLPVMTIIQAMKDLARVGAEREQSRRRKLN